MSSAGGLAIADGAVTEEDGWLDGALAEGA
jgi:hypothetical protein